MRRMSKCLGRREHHIRRTGDQILGLEDAIHAGLREEVPLLVRELPRQLAGRFCRIGQSGLHDAVPDPRRDPVPVTSNLPFNEWTEIFGSERLTGALLDRLTHHVHILELNGENYPLEHSKKARPPAAAPAS